MCTLDFQGWTKEPFKGSQHECSGGRQGPGACGAAVALPLICRVARASPWPPKSPLLEGQSLSFSCKRKRNCQLLGFTLSFADVFPVTEVRGAGPHCLEAACRGLGGCGRCHLPPPPPLHPALCTPPASSNNCGIWFPFNTKCETVRISELWLEEGILRRLPVRVMNFWC